MLSGNVANPSNFWNNQNPKCSRYRFLARQGGPEISGWINGPVMDQRRQIQGGGRLFLSLSAHGNTSRVPVSGRN